MLPAPQPASASSATRPPPHMRAFTTIFRRPIACLMRGARRVIRCKIIRRRFGLPRPGDNYAAKTGLCPKPERDGERVRTRTPERARSPHSAGETAAATEAAAATARPTGTADRGLGLAGKQAFALRPLAGEFARPTDRLRL